MSTFTKEDVIQNKKSAIKSLNKMLEMFINDPSGKHLKKANLLSYWIKDYIKMIKFEEDFNPKKNIVYKLRVYDPRNDYGVLSGIRLSPESLDKINDKLKELFINIH